MPIGGVDRYRLGLGYLPVDSPVLGQRVEGTERGSVLDPQNRDLIEGRGLTA
jgi:hypothetical protein